MKQPTATPLAIVGIGCLFPKANDPNAYWANLRDGVDAITEVPPTHWDPKAHYDPDPAVADKVYAQRGGFLDAVDFSPLDFGIAPRDIEATDTTQLLSLHVAAKALEDAGYGPGGKKFDRGRVGVVLGVTGALELVIPLGARLGHPIWRKALADAGVDPQTAEDVVERISDAYVPWQENSFPGLLGNVAAGRIANRLDLHGTNCVVDAACASSLSALHLAALELESHRADMVLAGGVDTFNDVFMYTCFSKTPALSPSGDARPFDKQADGTMLGEGVGIVAVKRLADAQRDGDQIYAVIKGIGSSSDGKGQAIYAPDSEGQARALRRAYELSGVSPQSIELVEAHGTGTKVGDATELRGLASVYADEAVPEQPWCAVGSVKSMIGHTKAAAGVAGLIKTALALRHKVLPPTLKVDRPSDVLDDGPFYVNTRKRPWLRSELHPRRAGVSAFGFGGSNFHCVLEESPTGDEAIAWDGQVQILAFCGQSRDALVETIEAFDVAPTWAEVRRDAARLRDAFSEAASCRLVLVVTAEDDLQARLDGAVKAVRTDARKRWSTPRGVSFGEGPAAGKLAGLFPGQGAQSVDMLRDLACQFPQMRTGIETVLDGQPEVSAALFPTPGFDDETRALQQARLTSTDVAQPALGAVSLGAFEVLGGFGVQIEAALGHSYGELTALAAAGRIPTAQLGEVSKTRGALMAAGSGDLGSMLAVRATKEELKSALAEHGLTSLTIANRNTPSQMVLSGATEAIERAEQRLGGVGMRVRRLDVAAAFHSPLVADAAVPFASALESVPFAASPLTVYANTSGQPYPDDAADARAMLAGQLGAPVEFVRCVQAMVADGVSTFVELGPGRRLAGLVSDIAKDDVASGAVVVTSIDASSGRTNGVVDLARMLASLAAWGHGAAISRWDPQVQQPVTGKKKLQIKVCGANAKPSKPAKPPVPPRAVTPAVTPSQGTPMADRPSAPPAVHASPAPAPHVEPNAALAATQANLSALMQLQQQTADLHRRFLEAQEHATRSFGALMAQQQTLLGGAPVQLAMSAVPSPMPAAQPPMAMPVAPVAAPLPIPSTPAPAPRVPPVTASPSPVVSAPPSRDASADTDVAGVLLDIVGNKTGYPPEMLELSMGLDADLGIDSIKRVEILSALAERLPNLPKIGPEMLGELQTLGQIVDYLGGSAQQVPTPAAKAPAAPTEDVASVLLDVVATKTGYPTDMLELDMGLDADLGIDSIKRVEILSALAERLPTAPKIGAEQLGELTTLGHIVNYLGGASGSGVATPTSVPTKTPTTSPPPQVTQSLDRYSVELGSTPVGGRVELPVGPIAVSGPDEGAEAVRAGLLRAGFDVVEVAWGASAPSSIAGFVIVAPRRPVDTFAAEALRSVREAGPSLRAKPNTLLAAITWLNGTLGFGGSVAFADESAALNGLIKTAAREWPEVHARTLDLPQTDGVDDAGRWLDGLLGRGPVELGLADNGFVSPEIVPCVATGSGVELSSDDVVVVSGGARGVTAAVAEALAKRFKSKLVLLGRSPEPGPAPEWISPTDTETEIKAKLLGRPDAPRSPREINEACHRLVAARQIRSTLASIDASGGSASYRSVDVRDGAAVMAAIEAIRTEVGAPTVLIHGAGVLADKRIEDKTDEDFDRVYGTKVEGARNLLAAIGPESLRALVFFSSSTARFGRVGQSDYAMANEALNKIAQTLAARHAGLRVAAVGWGPWDGGMVTPALAQMFANEGVKTIPLQLGAEHLLEEIAHSGTVETVVVGAGSVLETHAPVTASPAPSLQTAFERELSVADHPFLASHVLSGKAVLPTVMMLEWFAHAALAEHPGLAFVGLDDLQIFKGVRLGRSDRMVVRVEVGGVDKRQGQFFVPVELCSGGTNGHRVIHARGVVVLGNGLETAPSTQVPQLPTSGWSPDRAYAEALFHGEGFRALESIDGVAPSGIVVRTKSTPKPNEWMDAPVRRRWVADPLALDAGLQAMIVWSSAEAGSASLPNRLGRYRQFAAFPSDGARVCVSITHRTDAAATADLDWTDAGGKLLARLTDCEYTLDAGLRSAFDRNRVE